MGPNSAKFVQLGRRRRKCHTEVVIVAPVIWQLIITAHFLEIQSPLVYTLLYSFMNRLVVLCRHDDCLARSNVWCGRISRAWRISHATTTAARLTENWLDEELSRTNNTKKPFSGYILYFTHTVVKIPQNISAKLEHRLHLENTLADGKISHLAIRYFKISVRNRH